MTFPAEGFTMNHAMPARCAPPSGLIAVSSAPHSFPFAYVTCCMRVSLESGVETTSPGLAACAAGVTSNLQQPVPAVEIVTVVSSLRQCPCGTDVPGADPEPGCCCFGGTPYWPTARILLLRLSAGLAVSSEPVFDSVQTTNCFEVRVPALPETGICASSAALELKKYSVPPLDVANDEVPGDCD